MVGHIARWLRDEEATASPDRVHAHGLHPGGLAAPFTSRPLVPLTRKSACAQKLKVFCVPNAIHQLSDISHRIRGFTPGLGIAAKPSMNLCAYELCLLNSKQVENVRFPILCQDSIHWAYQLN